MRCWKCGEQFDTRERVGFRAECTRCGRAIHCCRNCDFHDASYNNECREPMAERVVDKERFNFCEYFAPGRAAPSADSGGKPDARAKLDALFRRKS
jgi:hypothetical protein